MLKNASDFHKELLKKFPYHPTSKQSELFLMLVDFIFSKDNQSLFLLKGYAGTGKTTTISTLVTNLWKIEKKAVLLAPTGRAAKVISGYSKKQAFTIHKNWNTRSSQATTAAQAISLKAWCQQAASAPQLTESMQ